MSNTFVELEKREVQAEVLPHTINVNNLVVVADSVKVEVS